ncbi:MAG: PAS domain-containing protein [Ignavibacteriaceae bacterium]
MDDKKKTKSELLKEISQLRRQVKKLENAEIEGKQIKNELYQSREMLQLILDTIPQRVFWKDLNFKYLGCNEKFAGDANLDSPFEIVGKNDFDLTWKELGNLYREDDREVIDNDSPKLDFEEFIIQSDGTRLWLKTSKVPLHDRNGNVIGILGTYENITQQKKNEENLEKEKILLRTIINNLPDAIFAKDTEGRKIITNLADLNNMGVVSESDVLGKTDFDFFPKETAEGFFANDCAVIKTGNAILKREECFVDKEGNKHWLQTSKLPLKDGQGNIIGLIGIGRDITEQKLAEEALREQTEKLKLIFENVYDGINIFEENYEPGKRRLIECNERYAEIAGRSREELLKIGNIEEAGLTNTLTGSNNKYINEGLVFTGSFTWDRPDKKENIIEYTAVPIKLNGKIFTIGIDRDVTEQRQIQQTLQKERILLKTLIDNLPDGIYVKDSECRKTLSNKADLRNMGKISEEEVLGKTDFEFFPKDIAEKFYEDDRAVINDGKAVLNREEFFTDDQGIKSWLLTSKLPLKDAKGATIGLIGIGRDITDQKLFEEALQNERNQLRTLIDNLPDLIFFKDANGRYILNNKAHLEFLGVNDQDEVAGKTVHDFHRNGQAEGFYEEEQEIIKNGKPLFEVEQLIFHKTKNENRWFLVSRIPLKKKDGKIKGILGVGHDITNRKNAESTLRQTYDELEQTNKELIEANKVKSQFLANMSHEIRTPLNAVIGMTGLLLDTPLNDEQRDFSETIFSSGDILLSLINDILDFSKIEAQKIELEKQSFDVRNCIEEALDLVASKAADKNLELLYSLDEGLSTNVIGDVTRLRQIIVNLLGNAIKFTEEGEVVVSASGQLKDNNNYMLHFSVRDTGLGIPLERQSRLFQSFTQVDASTTRKYGGTGLGLAISKQLSELMGGAMWLESTGIPGEGTTFHFTILAELSIENEVRTDLSALSGKRVLIVDDNNTNRNILNQQSSSLQMIPTLVASGAEALAELKLDHKFDLAILDYQMPEMDGIMLAEEIRKIPERKSLPLILLSSYGYQHNRNINLTYFAAALTKPIKFSQLHSALLTVLKKNTGSVKKQRDINSMQFDSGIGEHYPLKILLAEDNKVNQKVALRFLEKIGYRADVAFNGIEVLDALRRQFYDVILMDVQMPEMDGEQATIEIRKSFLPNQQPRIVAMTANALKSDREKYITSGMDDYIVKPFKIEELVRALVESYFFFHQIASNHEDADSEYINQK